jgi:hypothetical protein
LLSTEDQIDEYDLPTRPEKTDASREAVELDALPPEVLRQLINDAIERHVPRRELEVLNFWVSYIAARLECDALFQWPRLWPFAESPCAPWRAPRWSPCWSNWWSTFTKITPAG